jgi:hypothetical protein
MTTTRLRMVHASRRVYAGLLHLLPAEFRAAYGEPAIQTFLDMCSAEVRDRGRRGLLVVWSRVLPDLASSAVREWAARLWRRTGDRPPVASRLAAALPVMAALLVIYGQVRYPANLSLPEYAVYYSAIVAILAALAGVFLHSRVAAPLVVLCGLATTPCWILMFHIGRPGAALAGIPPVLCLIAIASLVKAARFRPSPPAPVPGPSPVP